MRVLTLALLLQYVFAVPAFAHHHYPQPAPTPTPTPSASADPGPVATNPPAPASSADAPTCLDHGAPLAINNDQVLQWKTSTPNQFLARGHIQGQIVQVYPDHSGHEHFSVQIGAASSDTIEVVYNISFGATATPVPGMTVEACGDYITSDAPAGPYPASPDGAILHWVHAAPSGGHDPGFLMIDGVLYGQ